jgi:hypothetical protein
MFSRQCLAFSSLGTRVYQALSPSPSAKPVVDYFLQAGHLQHLWGNSLSFLLSSIFRLVREELHLAARQ